MAITTLNQTQAEQARSMVEPLFEEEIRVFEAVSQPVG
jgi:hypothetical protein